MTLTACMGAILLMNRLSDSFGGETQPPPAATQLELTRPNTGLERLQRRARRGDAGAQYRLGVAYRDGHGTPVDYETAAFYFRQA
ncbi:MAG: SEL1-like repeat protein, partial [Gammaproteobacteria bacterium]|nr:SEL1-like repeat protein [Gammaproteobacteria bacterium]